MIFSVGGLTAIYSAMGALCSCGMFAAFPPERGFVPSTCIRILAFFVFALFWPIIVLLSLAHFVGTVYRYLIGETLELRMLGNLFCRSKFAGISPRQKEWYSDKT